jgi:hypothetical protein
MVAVGSCGNVVTTYQIARENTILIFTVAQTLNLIKEFSLFNVLKCVIVTYIFKKGCEMRFTAFPVVYMLYTKVLYPQSCNAQNKQHTARKYVMLQLLNYVHGRY